jgi:hypothetical protein
MHIFLTKSIIKRYFKYDLWVPGVGAFLIAIPILFKRQLIKNIQVLEIFQRIKDIS